MRSHVNDDNSRHLPAGEGLTSMGYIVMCGRRCGFLSAFKQLLDEVFVISRV